MIGHHLKKPALMGASLYMLICTAQAGAPIWTFQPVEGFPSSVTVGSTGTAIIKYIVTNQSSKPHTLQMNSIQGITPSGCTSPLGARESCTLVLNVSGSELKGDVNGGPKLCDQGSQLQCYQPSSAHSLAINLTQQPSASATLTPLVSSMALSVNCLPSSPCASTQNAALTGNSRQFVFQNTGSVSATNVSVITSSLPSGTTISSNTCTGTVNAGASCSVTLTPGSVASPGLNGTPCTSGTAPQASLITVTADGGISSQVSAYVLGYACLYQGGFLYSVNDTTPPTGSIGGSVVTQQDQVAFVNYNTGPGALWSSNGVGGSDASYVSDDSIPGISASSTTSTPLPTYDDSKTVFDALYANSSVSEFLFPSSSSFNACDGIADGACNSENILTFYNKYKTNYGIGSSPYTLLAGPTTSSFYAAGTCTQTISGYSDWYLPAVCQMATTFEGGGFSCVSGTQNISEQLVGFTGSSCTLSPNCLTGTYWTSTEEDGNTTGAWRADFSNNPPTAWTWPKYLLAGVRCTRDLTP